MFYLFVLIFIIFDNSLMDEFQGLCSFFHDFFIKSTQNCDKFGDKYSKRGIMMWESNLGKYKIRTTLKVKEEVNI